MSEFCSFAAPPPVYANYVWTLKPGNLVPLTGVEILRDICKIIHWRTPATAENQWPALAAANPDLTFMADGQGCVPIKDEKFVVGRQLRVPQGWPTDYLTPVLGFQQGEQDVMPVAPVAEPQFSQMQPPPSTQPPPAKEPDPKQSSAGTWLAVGLVAAAAVGVGWWISTKE